MFKTFLCVFLALTFLTACSTRPTQYTVDPEVTIPAKKNEQSLSFMVSVLTPEKINQQEQNKIFLQADDDFANRVKQNLVSALTQNGYQVGSNKHFVDYQLSFDFTKLQAVITQGMVKDEIAVNGNLTIIANDKTRQFSKAFKVNNGLTVALKSNYAEVTGLVNKTVSELIRIGLEDKDFNQFVQTKSE